MENMREQLDRLFEIGLFLLGILSSSWFQIAMDIDKAFALWFYTFPLMFLILLWLIKSISTIFMRNRIRKLYGFRIIVLLTEFCWNFWGNLVFYYLILPAKGTILLFYGQVYIGMPFMIILSGVINLAYVMTCLGKGGEAQKCSIDADYSSYCNKIWIFYRLVLSYFGPLLILFKMLSLTP
jgi:hypothetical protein